MNNKLIFFLILLILAGCNKDIPDPSETTPSKIDGLELTFPYTNFKENFNSIHFINEQVGYIAGYGGALYKTVDGGNSWTALNSNTSLPLYDIYFLNPNEGFVVGGENSCGGTGCVPKGAVVIHTTDGGQTWNQVPVTLSEKVELKSICFSGDSSGFTVGGGLILSTKDRGRTWQETKINNLGALMNNVKFVNEKNGLISCTVGKLLKTTDGGITWNISTPFTASTTLAAVNEKLVFSAGFPTFKKSSDFGNTWLDLPNSPSDILKLIFKSETTGYAFGSGKYSGGDLGVNYGAIYYTTDGGSTWKGNNKISETEAIISASFPSVNIGYALSRNAVVKITRQ